jgi:hypothetical protein
MRDGNERAGIDQEGAGVADAPAAKNDIASHSGDFVHNCRHL